jgi:hypothetical protein
VINQEEWDVWANVARLRERKSTYRGLVGKRERPLGKLRCSWEENIKMDFQEIKWENMDWIDLA